MIGRSICTLGERVDNLGRFHGSHDVYDRSIDHKICFWAIYNNDPQLVGHRKCWFIVTESSQNAEKISLEDIGLRWVETSN